MVWVSLVPGVAGAGSGAWRPPGALSTPMAVSAPASDTSIGKVETKVWSRYVKRMMNKPGCNLDKANAKKIYEFLSYDSTKRKTGANAEKWAAHRKSLIEKLKTEKPARYKELQESKDL